MSSSQLVKYLFRKLGILVFVIPVLFFIVGANFNRAIFVNDPNYIYLMNALCICKGHAVGNIHNPGTTVMQATAATSMVAHWFSNPNGDALIDQVIKNPEKFIGATSAVFAFLNGLILALLGWVTFRKSRSVWLAIFLQAATLISSNTLDYVWTKLSPEPLLFFFTCAFVLLVVLFYFESDKTQRKYALWFALITGGGLATKATFLPLVLFPLIALPGQIRKLQYVGGLIPAFVLFTIPAVPEYKSLFNWFRGMITHSGMYGNGAKGIIDTASYVPNIQGILQNNPIIAYSAGIALFMLIVSLIMKKRNLKNGEFAILSGLFVTLIFGVLLVAKHYKADHYLIPILLLCGVTLVMAMQTLAKIVRYEGVTKMLAPVVLAGFLFYSGKVQVPKMKQINLDYKIASGEISDTYKMIAEEYSDYIPVNYYIFSMNKFTALKFGDDFSKAKIREDLKRIYPDTYFYEFSSNQFFRWNEKIEFADIMEKHGERLILLNGPTDENTLAEMGKRGFPVEQIYKGRSQNLFIYSPEK